MDNNAILLVSFGTTYNDARIETLDVIENYVALEFNSSTVYHCYTSDFIIKKLKERDNIQINTLEQSLNQIIKDNVSTLIVQPTFITDGIEYSKMLETLKKYKNSFKSLKIGFPLLKTNEDYNTITDTIISNFCPLEHDTALICVGHGTDCNSNLVYTITENIFKSKGYNNIFVLTLNSLNDIDSLKAKLNKIRTIIIAPLMLVSGKHVKKDISVFSEKLEKEGYKVLSSSKGLGQYQEVRDLIIKHITRLINDEI